MSDGACNSRTSICSFVNLHNPGDVGKPSCVTQETLSLNETTHLSCNCVCILSCVIITEIGLIIIIYYYYSRIYNELAPKVIYELANAQCLLIRRRFEFRE